jgi:hypothetical protein
MLERSRAKSGTRLERNRAKSGTRLERSHAKGPLRKPSEVKVCWQEAKSV